jgi:hypothetical protein
MVSLCLIFVLLIWVEYKFKLSCHNRLSWVFIYLVSLILLTLNRLMG